MKADFRVGLTFFHSHLEDNKYMTIKTRLSSIFMGLALFGSVTSVAMADDNVQTFINYQGEVIDQDAIAVSGVLPLEFRIYTSQTSKKAIATEKHFISVVDGKYQLTLGDASPINTTEPALYVAVLLDGKELTRQKVETERYIVNAKPEGSTTQTKYVKLSDSKDGEFSLNCPKGYIVTGIEGRRVNGQMDTLRLICTNVF